MIRCRLFGHKKSLSSTGYGFGVLDYYCSRCQKRIESVPLADLNDAERERVIGYGGFSTMTATPTPPDDTKADRAGSPQGGQ